MALALLLPATVADGLTIGFASPAGCRLEAAQVSFVPPAAARVVVVSECGGVVCWERWIVTEGGRRELGRSRTCDAPMSELPVPATPWNP